MLVYGRTGQNNTAHAKYRKLLLPRVFARTRNSGTKSNYRKLKDNNVHNSRTTNKARINPSSHNKKAWYWLLVIPYLAILWLPSYNRIEPRAFGIPFYYWYQLLWVVLSTLIIAVVLYFSHMRKRPGAQTHKR